MPVLARARAELAPGGTIRAGVNIANPATIRTDADGKLGGPIVDLARGLGALLGLPVEFVRFTSAGQIVAAQLAGDAWDIAFLAVDPGRAERLHFSPSYMTIEARYAVPACSPIATIDEVDRPGVRIATSRGAAYDLHLQRTLRSAERCPFPSPRASFDAFAGGGHDVVAGVSLALEQRFGGDAGFRLLPGHFLSIHQAIATPVDRPAAAEVIDRFVEARRAPAPP